MTREDLLQACRQWVIWSTEIDATAVYLLNEATAPPTRPCIGLRLTTPGRRLGHDGGQTGTTASGDGDGTLVRTIHGQRVATVRFVAYGAGGYDLLEKMRAAEARFDGQERATELLISPLLQEPQEVPSPTEDGRFEIRFIADATVGYVATSTESVMPVDTATGSGETGGDFEFTITTDMRP